MNAEKIKEKIKNLQNKTEENGATKEEAETALRLARNLIDKYGLEKTKVETVINSTDFKSKPKEKTQTFKKSKVKFYKKEKKTSILKKILYFYLAIKASAILFDIFILFILSRG